MHFISAVGPYGCRLGCSRSAPPPPSSPLTCACGPPRCCRVGCSVRAERDVAAQQGAATAVIHLVAARQAARDQVVVQDGGHGSTSRGLGALRGGRGTQGGWADDMQSPPTCPYTYGEDVHPTLPHARMHTVKMCTLPSHTPTCTQ